jgi:GR25 family glycosyltransferase involved in LPS biosynthesis
MKVYVISLSEPRALLDRIGADAVWVRGVRGATASDESIHADVAPVYARWGPKSAIGCAMSHMLSWRQFLATDDTEAVVVEDDVVFEPAWRETLDETLRHVPRDYDVLYLGCLGCDATERSAVWPVIGAFLGNASRDVNAHVRVPDVAFGNHAYVVSRKGAQRLLDELTGTLDNHIDFCIQRLARHGRVERYVMTPRVAYQTSTDTNVSLNVSSSHPRFVQKLIEPLSIDRMVRLNYLGSVSIARVLPNVHLNTYSILFLALGVALSRYSVSTLTTAFVLLSTLDLLYVRRASDGAAVLLHYLLFVLPAVARHAMQ